MKLYYMPGACSLAAHIALREAGLPFDLELVDGGSKKTKSSEDYMTINPKGAVPAIRLEDGQLLTEAAVIQQYIADADGVPAHVSAQYQSMDENRRSRALDLASRATNARDVEGYRRELELFEWVF